MFNKYWIEASDTEFDKHVPKLNTTYLVKDKEFLFYGDDNGENLAILKMERDWKELYILTAKKTGWRPNAKKLIDVMKKSLVDHKEIYLLVNMTKHEAVYDFVTGEELTYFGIIPHYSAIKKEIKCLAVEIFTTESGIKTSKPVILCSFMDNLPQLMYFKNCGMFLTYSEMPPTIYGSKIFYRALMEKRGFDPEVSLGERLEEYISPKKSPQKVTAYNCSKLLDMFKVVADEKTTKIVKEVIDELQLTLPGISTGFETMELTELVEKLKKPVPLESVGAKKVFILRNQPELEEQFPYEISELYLFWATINLAIDKTKPKESWGDRPFDRFLVQKEFERILGFNSHNKHQLAFTVPNKPGIINL